METKLFEVRDRMTFIPVIVINLNPGNEADRFLLGRAGFGTTVEDQQHRWLYASLNILQFEVDPMASRNRTQQVSHLFIIEHWMELESGAVIDVEHIMGETTAPKVSERLQQC